MVANRLRWLNHVEPLQSVAYCIYIYIYLYLYIHTYTRLYIYIHIYTHDIKPSINKETRPGKMFTTSSVHQPTGIHWSCPSSRLGSEFSGADPYDQARLSTNPAWFNGFCAKKQHTSEYMQQHLVYTAGRVSSMILVDIFLQTTFQKGPSQRICFKKPIVWTSQVSYPFQRH